MSDAVLSFPALRPHQRHGWHAFLVQLGALAVHRSGTRHLPTDAAQWTNVLRYLTSPFKEGEPWSLVVHDITTPAFLQPPASSAAREVDYKSTISTPDELDMLRTGKNHDLKSTVAVSGDTDDWIFALITRQTMDGYHGRGQYGISRMNGGNSNRSALSFAPPGGVGAHIRRDILALLDRREDMLTDFPRTDPYHALIWTLPWDGTKQEVLSPSVLDPFYIEICRRIRMYSGSNGRLHGRRATSKGERIGAKQLKGITGDPWTPVNSKDGKSLTLSPPGFTYRRITDYLTSPDYLPRPVLLKPTGNERSSKQELRLVARALVRGQGKTEGYYERIIPFRPLLVTTLGTQAGTRTVGDMCRERIEHIGILQRILRYGILVFLARGRPQNTRRDHGKYAEPWLRRLDQLVDADFFVVLQDELEAPDGERSQIQRDWLLKAVGHARSLLQDATNALPCPAIDRYRARTSAQDLFERRLRGRNGLPFMFDKE